MKIFTVLKIFIAYVITMLVLPVYSVIGKKNSNNTFDIQVNSNTRSVVITCRNCFKFQEEVLMEVLCLSEWCNSNLFQYTYKDPLLIVDQLTPFTTYTLNIKTCKKVKSYYKSCMKINKTLYFQTKPSTPRFVQELQAYSKNERSVSLRWKPPYPPTGQLHGYEVQYFIDDQIEETLTKQFPIQSCELWPNYHCYTLLDLESKQNYSISLRAKNEKLPEFGQVQTISVITKKEPSEAPYDLNVQWTDNEQLTLNWKHPNKTNGDIEYFIITLSVYQNQDKPIKKHFFKSISKHTWQYTYTINEKAFLNLTQFEIEITAFNGCMGNKLSVNFSNHYYQEENKIDTQRDNTNKFEQVFYNNATEIGNKNYEVDQEQFDNSSNIFDNLEEKKEEGVEGSDNSFDRQTISRVPFNYYEEEQSHTISSGLPKSGNRILEKGNIFATLLLSLILSSVIIIFIIIFAVLWIKKFSWNNESNCMFCKRVSNNAPHEEAPLRNLENTKSDDMHLYTPETILKIQGNRNKKNMPILEHENEEYFSKPIELEKFKEYVDMSAKEGDIENEFKMFVEKTPKTVYETLDHQLFEYIDLVYDDGTVIPKAYVATKMPIEDNIQNFWKQIFEDNIQLIVLLGEVGSKELQYKYQQYWPEENEKMEYSDISVHQLYNKSFSYYTIRKFVLVVEGTIKQIEQIHCPHSGSNPLKLAPFIKKLVQLQIKSGNSSVLVHSSTEIGGVGTVILCALSLRLADNEKTIDVLKGMHMLRKHKPGFIRNAEQYKLIYLIISHVLFPHEDDNSKLNDYANF